MQSQTLDGYQVPGILETNHNGEDVGGSASQDLDVGYGFTWSSTFVPEGVPVADSNRFSFDTILVNTSEYPEIPDTASRRTPTTCISCPPLDGLLIAIASVI